MDVVSIDIAFVVDGTVSMNERFPRAAIFMREIMRYLSEALIEERGLECTVRMALVVFTDYDPRDQLPEEEQQITWVIQPFTTEMSDLEEIGYVEQGGEDEPEAILAGLNTALDELEWRSTYKVVMLITDSLPHGRHFHWQESRREVGDSYPSGDPTGLKLSGICRRLVQNDIRLWLYALSNVTEHFADLLGAMYEIVFEREDMFLCVPMPNEPSYPNLTVDFIHMIADDVVCIPYTLLQTCRHHIWMDPERYIDQAWRLPTDLLVYLDWPLETGDSSTTTELVEED